MAGDAGEALDLDHAANGYTLPLADGLGGDREAFGQLGDRDDLKGFGQDWVSHNSEGKLFFPSCQAWASTSCVYERLPLPQIGRMTPGDRIKVARKKANLSQLELAARFRLKRPSVSNWERNENLPRGTRLTELSEILGVTPGWILSGAESEDGGEAEMTTPLSQPRAVSGFRRVTGQDGKTLLMFLDDQKRIAAELLLDQDQVTDLIADLLKAYP